jgi:hypothetical protein
MRRLIRAAGTGDAHAQFNLGILYDSRLDDNGHASSGWLPSASWQSSTPAAQAGRPATLKPAFGSFWRKRA